MAKVHRESNLAIRTKSEEAPSMTSATSNNVVTSPFQPPGLGGEGEGSQISSSFEVYPSFENEIPAAYGADLAGVSYPGGQVPQTDFKSLFVDSQAAPAGLPVSWSGFHAFPPGLQALPHGLPASSASFQASVHDYQARSATVPWLSPMVMGASPYLSNAYVRAVSALLPYRLD